MWIITQFRQVKIKYSDDYHPKLSIIISAYNEEKFIEKTLRGILNSEYPNDKLEVLVGSDCSDDKTNEIVKSLQQEYSNLIFYPFTERRGKINVVSDLVRSSMGEILVFADANTIYKKQSIKNLIKYFIDERVGAVCGKLRILNIERAEEEGNLEKTYWEYETFIKILEGKLGIVFGANGGIYAIRKTEFRHLAPNTKISDDLYYSAAVLINKKYLMYANDAVAEEFVLPSVELEFKRKIRMAPNVIATTKNLKQLLSPKYGLIAFSFWSHKIFRWISPILLILIFIFCVALSFYSLVYLIILLLQLVFYFFALIGHLLNKIKINLLPFSAPYYFVLSTIALLIGLYKIFLGNLTTHWESAGREK